MNTSEYQLYICGYKNLGELLESKTLLITRMIEHYEYWLAKPDDFFVDHPSFKPKNVCLNQSAANIEYTINRLEQLGDYLQKYYPDNLIINSIYQRVNYFKSIHNQNIAIRLEDN